MDGWIGKWDETHKKASQNQLSTPDKKEPPTKKDAAAETDPAVYKNYLPFLEYIIDIYSLNYFVIF